MRMLVTNSHSFLADRARGRASAASATGMRPGNQPVPHQSESHRAHAPARAVRRGTHDLRDWLPRAPCRSGPVRGRASTALASDLSAPRTPNPRATGTRLFTPTYGFACPLLAWSSATNCSVERAVCACSTATPSTPTPARGSRSASPRSVGSRRSSAPIRSHVRSARSAHRCVVR